MSNFDYMETSNEIAQLERKLLKYKTKYAELKKVKQMHKLNQTGGASAKDEFYITTHAAAQALSGALAKKNTKDTITNTLSKRAYMGLTGKSDLKFVLSLGDSASRKADELKQSASALGSQALVNMSQGATNIGQGAAALGSQALVNMSQGASALGVSLKESADKTATAIARDAAFSLLDTQERSKRLAAYLKCRENPENKCIPDAPVYRNKYFMQMGGKFPAEQITIKDFTFDFKHIKGNSENDLVELYEAIKNQTDLPMDTIVRVEFLPGALYGFSDKIKEVTYYQIDMVNKQLVDCGDKPCAKSI